MRRSGAIAVSLVAAFLALFATSAVAATPHWTNLRTVTVTVANGSLPPPYGRPHETRFTTASQLKRVTAALNANKIAARRPVPSTGCVGGYEVTIAISRKQGAGVRLSAYRCGAKTFGAIAGNLAGFLAAVGVRAP